MESSGVRHLSIKSSACVCLQGDYVWLEPENQGEFDVAIGAQVKAVGGGQIHLQDDDNKVSKIGLPSTSFENHYHKGTPPLIFGKIKSPATLTNQFFGQNCIAFFVINMIFLFHLINHKIENL